MFVAWTVRITWIIRHSVPQFANTLECYTPENAVINGNLDMSLKIIGCPNDCYSDLGKGSCLTNSNNQSSCVCNAGWTGPDCSKGNKLFQ